MSDIKLTQPRVAVVTESAAGELLETIVQTDNRDAIAWDLQRGRRNYPPATEAAMLWLTFLAWNALRRTGSPVGKFDEFLTECISVRTVKDDDTPADPDDEDAYTVGPTRPAPEPA